MRSSWKSLILTIIIAFALIISLSFFLKFLEKLILKKVEAKSLNFAAIRVYQEPVQIINIQAKKGITFVVKFKNVGSKNWLKGKVALRKENGKSLFAHPSWPNESTPYIVKWGVPVNSVGTFKFALLAPETNGLYWEKFYLFNGQEKIPGGEIEIGMKVYGGKEPVFTPLNQNNLSDRFWEIFPSEYEVKEEIRGSQPMIRVGLFYENSEKPYVYLPIRIQTRDKKPYRIKILNENTILLTQTQGEETEINFDFSTKKYFINVNGQRIAMTDSPIRFIPANENEMIVFKITSWYRGPFWGEECNDNEYKGELEIRYNPKTDRLWLINELPIEEYLKGVAEVKDSYPYEALKAQKIAARTYAYIRIILPKYTNVPEEDFPLFHVRATQADQVYRGYLWELRSPNIKRAAEETYGMVALYNDSPILAYYFAQSDGKTRSSCEVKMTKECLPYLTSVDDPAGIGLKLIGHGVGLPQRSAKVIAEKGAKFHQILRYYYRGIEIKKIW